MLLLWAPFAVSAVLHYGAAVTRGCPGAAVAGFFMWQPVGMLVEREVGLLVRLDGWKRTRVCVSWVWTVAWLVWSSRRFWEGFGEGGLWGMEPVPVSAWRWAGGEGAWRWEGVGGRYARPEMGEGNALGGWGWVL